MRTKLITFLWQDMNRHTINTLQWKTAKRTTMGAWEDAVAFLINRNPDADPQHLMTLNGLVKVLDDETPLRKPTIRELKQLAKSF